MKVLIFPASLVLQLFQAAAGQAGFDWRIRQSCFNPHVCINLSFLIPAFHTVGLFARVWEYRREQAKAQILLRVWLKHPVDCQRNRWCRNSFLAAGTTYPENIACPNSILELWTSLHFHLIPLLHYALVKPGDLNYWTSTSSTVYRIEETMLNFWQFSFVFSAGFIFFPHPLCEAISWSVILNSLLPLYFLSKRINLCLMFQPATLLWWYSKVCP